MKELTKEQIKDLEVVVGMAFTSGYLDNDNFKICERVEELIKQIKKNCGS